MPINFRYKILWEGVFIHVEFIQRNTTILSVDIAGSAEDQIINRISCGIGCCGWCSTFMDDATINVERHPCRDMPNCDGMEPLVKRCT